MCNLKLILFAGEKWSCTNCTYLNYPRAIRCSQCYGSRPSSVATSSSETTVTPPTSPKSSPTGFSPPHKIQHSMPSKLSSPTSHKNKQSPSRSRQSPILSIRQSPSRSPPLKSRQSPPLRTTRQTPSPKSCKSPPRLQSPPSNKVSHETQTSSPTEDTCSSVVQSQPAPLHKWRCPSCTYENWPRSTKCCMCRCMKPGLDESKGSKSPNKSLQDSNIENNCGHANSSAVSITGKIARDNDSTSSNSSPGSDNFLNTPASSTKSFQCDAAELSLQPQYIVNEESKTCESINIINRNRSSLAVVSSSSVSSSQNSLATLSVSSLISCNNTTPPFETTIITTSSGLSSSALTTPIITPASGACVGSVSSSLHSRVETEVQGAVALNNYETEKLLRQLRKRLRDTDLAFLNACVAVVEGNCEPVETYLSSGGDPMRQLSNSDVKLLARPSAFTEGQTLVHLAIRYV